MKKYKYDRRMAEDYYKFSRKIMMDNHKKQYCLTCGLTGESKLRGSGWITFILLCFYLVPGFIYMIWRRGGNECQHCNAKTLVPEYSPVAIKMKELAVK